MENPKKKEAVIDKNSRKVLALFIIFVAYYLILVGFEFPAIASFRINWAYAVGMTAAVCWSLADRFLKHVNSPEFKTGKLIKPHLLFFLVFCPASLFVILPKLGPPQNIWSADYKTAFLISYFVITAGPKITINYERFVKYLNGSKKTK